MLGPIVQSLVKALVAVRANGLECSSRHAYLHDDMQTAVLTGQKLHACDPDNPWGLYIAAVICLEEDRYSDALPSLLGLSQAWPLDSWTFYAVGVCLEQADRAEEAVPYYFRSLALQPGSLPAMKSLGRTLYLSGNYRAAKEHLDAYCSEKPDDQEAQELLGFVCYKLGAFMDSYSHYGQALTLDPANPRMDRNARLLYRRSATS